jgi:hypothetical protein
MANWKAGKVQHCEGSLWRTGVRDYGGTVGRAQIWKGEEDADHVNCLIRNRRKGREKREMEKENFAEQVCRRAGGILKERRQ